MTSVWGRGRPCCKRSSAAPSVAPPNSSPPPELGDKLFDEPAGPSGAKPPVVNAPATTSVPKYSKDDLQRILKAILEAWAPVPAPAPISAPALISAPVFVLIPASIIAEAAREKVKVRPPDVYRGKSQMDCYNFCQQCVDYFATTGATGSTQILFAVSFLRDRISFWWQ